ncbi:MAG: hypothetical protein HY904_10840 [Deltaproteobacteria bacterium]|nr:hypothetical protein [Deltaproteobacteria bacterium]
MRRAERLADEITTRADGRTRVDLETLWAAFNAAFPQERGRASARGELEELLRELAEQGVMKLPSSPRSFDRVQQPPLPRWVALPGPDAHEPVRDARGLAWHPALEFVHGLARLNPNEWDFLERVQEFLARGGANEPVLTVRERSVRLLGDDKRLEAWAEGRLFGPGRLDLALLRCRCVHEPLVSHDAGTGVDGLIIENKDTYASAVSARSMSTRAHAVRWIVYGSGNAVIQAFPGTTEWPEGPRRWLYFGDIDGRGLEIALRLDDVVRRLTGQPLVPALALYDQALRRGRGLRLQLTGKVLERDVLDRVGAWVGGEMGEGLAEVLAAGGRIPQEVLSSADMQQFMP